MTERPLTKIDPTAVVAQADKLYHQGKCDAAIGLLVAAGKQMPPDLQIPVKLAELLMDSEHFEDAFSVLEKIPAQGNSHLLTASMGYCAARKGDFRQASESADRLLALDPESPIGMHLKGLVASYTGALEDADYFFTQAFSLDPDYGEAYTDLGILKKMNGDTGQALDLLEKGFECAPTKRNVALAYHTEIVTQSKFERAESSFEAAVTAHRGNQRLLFLYTDILLRLHKARPALKVIQDCLVLFGPDKGLLDAALQVRSQIEQSGPIDAEIGQKHLSLCMIVKNEEMHLARCLMSVQNLVGEMILVDTGSTDLTVKIGQVFGAKIYSHEWRNDFSEARNVSLSKATGDWILILDADEVISPPDQDRLSALINCCDRADTAYSVVTRNYTRQANLVGWQANRGEYPSEEEGTGWYPSPKVRLFPNDRRILYQYPIHELVEPSLKRLGITIESCPVPVHHYGKLNGSKNDEKANAYYAMGLKKLEALGDNAVALREMAVQAAGLERYAEAADLWHRFLKLDPENAEAYVNMGTACWQIADYKKAVRYSEKAISLASYLKEAHFNSAIAYMYSGDAIKAISILEKLLKRHQRYLAALFMLASAYACTAAEEKARNVFEQLLHQISDFELQTAVTEVVARLKRAKLTRYAQNLRRFSLSMAPVREQVSPPTRSYIS